MNCEKWSEIEKIIEKWQFICTDHIVCVAPLGTMACFYKTLLWPYVFKKNSFNKINKNKIWTMKDCIHAHRKEDLRVLGQLLKIEDIQHFDWYK